MPNNTVTLPGAEKFFAFLQTQCLERELRITGQEVADSSDCINYTKRWEIFAGDVRLGEYKTFGPRHGSGETQPTREYDGIIPGYLNGRSVMLIYSNKRFDSGIHSLGDSGRIIETPWRRQDGHTTIVFP